MLRSVRILVVSVACLTVVASAPAVAQEPEGFSVTGWILESGSNELVRHNADGISTLSVAGVMLAPDGTAVSAPSDGAMRLLKTAHRQGLEAELLVSNYSNALEDFDPDAAHLLLDSERNIAAVAQRLARFASRGWDGINVDLERLRMRDADGLVAFVEAIQDRMPAARTVTIDVSATSSLQGYRERGYRMNALADAADTIKLMTYDQHGPTWTRPGPISALHWQRQAVKAALRVVPPGRLDLGVAGYGYSWPEKGTGRSLAIRQVRGMLNRNDARPHWNSDVGEWTATLSNGTVLWWSDRRSYDERIDLAREYDLHGLAVWRVGSADTLR